MNKYHARRTTIDNFTFDSAAEGRRYQELKLLVSAGEIEELQVHPSYPCVVNGVKVCTYKADFQYLDRRTGKYIVEDVKGVKTPVYRVKKKLFFALYGINILETK